MHITHPIKDTQLNLVQANLQLNNKEYNVYFQGSKETVLSSNLETFITLSLLPCMLAGGDSLSANGEVSEKYLSRLSTIQDIYRKWEPSSHRIELPDSIPVKRVQSIENRVGVFFSGGVDSWYSFLKHQDEITDLIFVHGFDIQLNDTRLREKSSSKIHEVARCFNKNVIEIETNIRDLLDEYVSWGYLGHGPALAAIGHLLTPHVNQVYIPSSYTYSDLSPSGSHPVLDYLWGTESLKFVHDGCEASRVEKVALISTCDIALKTLRVCWENPNSAYNCGRCEKCIRTMINLQANNVLHKCTTFDQPIDINHFLKLDMRCKYIHTFIKENLTAIQNKGGNEELARAMKKVLNRPKWIDALRKRLRMAYKQLMTKYKTIPSE